MTIRPIRTVLTIAALSATTAFYSCKDKANDSDIQAAIENAKAGDAKMSGVTATVKDGDVTLNGSVPDEATKAAAEANVKAIKGVGTVTNNLTIAAPVAETPAQVSSPLEPGVMDAIKSYPTVKASVKDSVIMLEGSISKADNIKLTQALNSLHPKKIDRSKFSVK
jgi:hyperosmotically inducible protein